MSSKLHKTKFKIKIMGREVFLKGKKHSIIKHSNSYNALSHHGSKVSRQMIQYFKKKKILRYWQILFKHTK